MTLIPYKAQLSSVSLKIFFILKCRLINNRLKVSKDLLYLRFLKGNVIGLLKEGVKSSIFTFILVK